jgi:hypothetical protein
VLGIEPIRVGLEENLSTKSSDLKLVMISLGHSWNKDFPDS